MSKEYKITANGLKLIVIVLTIIGILFGAHRGYTIYSETTKLNSDRYKELKPRVNKNEKDIIAIAGKIEPIGKRQERMCIRQEKMNDKLDKILEKVR
jgi:hypothetical protein